MATCLIGLGSNLGERDQNLARAIGLLRAIPVVEVQSVSHLHESKPAGGPAGQGRFLNSAALLETALEPPALLAVLQKVENELGRVRGERWGERIVDLDLLLYDDLELETPTLKLPHPRMSFRRFVLQPAAEIASQMIYPINGWTIAELLARVMSPAKYVAVSFPPFAFQVPLTRVFHARMLRGSDDFNPTRASRFGCRESLLNVARQRASLICRWDWPTSLEWTISDFWFDDITVIFSCMARGLAPLDIDGIRSEVVEPNLVVVPDWTKGSSPVPAALQSVQNEIDNILHDPRTGPALRIGANVGPDDWLAEVLAAIQAME